MQRRAFCALATGDDSRYELEQALLQELYRSSMGARQLERARDAFARQAWADADEYFAVADRAGALEAADLESFATASFMVGRLDDYVALLDRAYAAHLTAGERLRAVRCAFWIGVNLAQRGQLGAAGGWLARAQRLVEHESRCPEGGYLLLPVIFQREAAGDLEGAARVAAEAASIGAELGDRDLFALAAHEQGHLLIPLGRIVKGVALLDEAMLAVTERELAPIPTGIVHCGAILAADDAFELGRAQEWTAALSDWCGQQPDLVAFTGRCLVHRAQVMQRRGAWDDALAEAHRAAERCLRGENPAAAGEARYVEAEIHRLRGA